MRHSSPPVVLLAAALLILTAACGSTGSAVRPKPAAAPAADESGPAAKVELPVVRLGQEFELHGFAGASIAETGLSVFLSRVRWSEVEIDGNAFREGYAQLGVRSAAGEEILRVDMGERGESRGYEIEVLFVGDFMDERTARTLPHARLVVRRK